ncbi:MAG: hypothetical protein WAM15_03635, partial [Candidatus Acidiferrales bacterium]
MAKQFRGCTEDADAPFLDAKFWAPGTKVAGKVMRTFKSENGPCAVIALLDPVKLDGKLEEIASIGNLTGFRMALQAAGLESLEAGDQVHVECTGKTTTDKGSPRVNFEVEV